MQKALVGCLLLAILGVPSLAAENTYSVGGGIAVSRTEVDQGAEMDGTGGFATFRFNARHGAILLFTVSATEGDDTAGADIGTTTVDAKVEDSFLRAGLSAGFMFRRDSVLRVFLHAGFSYLDVQEKIDGVDSVDDSSFALTVGGGIEVGRGRHAGYLNVGYDYDHDVDYVVPLTTGNVGGRSGFNMLELQIGYIYNF
jgi:hypothetical protein